MCFILHAGLVDFLGNQKTGKGRQPSSIATLVSRMVLLLLWTFKAKEDAVLQTNGVKKWTRCLIKHESSLIVKYVDIVLIEGQGMSPSTVLSTLDDLTAYKNWFETISGLPEARGYNSYYDYFQNCVTVSQD